jgi:hypothetical protein
MVTEVGALPVNVAVLSGTVGLELQLVPMVHSAPGPVHVPSTACADWGNSAANAPSHTPPSSAARAGGRKDGAAARMARPATEAAGAGRRARAACRCERITPGPPARSTAGTRPCHSSCRPHGSTNLRRYGCRRVRSILACLGGGDWPTAVALPPRAWCLDLGTGASSTTIRNHVFIASAATRSCPGRARASARLFARGASSRARAGTQGPHDVLRPLRSWVHASRVYPTCAH